MTSPTMADYHSVLHPNPGCTMHNGRDNEQRQAMADDLSGLHPNPVVPS